MRHLNNYQQKLKFTIEREGYGTLPYLDMSMKKEGERVMTNWYSKNRASGRMINFNSTQPRNMKKKTAINFIKRVRTISDKRFEKEHKEKIFTILTHLSQD